jgi:hypothetical protein
MPQIGQQHISVLSGTKEKYIKYMVAVYKYTNYRIKINFSQKLALACPGEQNSVPHIE